jgi:hypothetical protein
MLSVIMHSVTFIYCCWECHYAECSFNEYRVLFVCYAECGYADCRYAQYRVLLYAMLSVVKLIVATLSVSGWIKLY